MNLSFQSLILWNLNVGKFTIKMISSVSLSFFMWLLETWKLPRWHTSYHSVQMQTSEHGAAVPSSCLPGGWPLAGKRKWGARKGQSPFPPGRRLAKTHQQQALELTDCVFCAGLFLPHSKAGSALSRGKKEHVSSPKYVAQTRLSWEDAPFTRVKGKGPPGSNLPRNVKGSWINTVWAPANLLHYFMVDPAVPKEAQV